MANDDHLAQLMKGVASWKSWREKNHSILPDFRGADLRGADLREANLFVANLSEANLSGADERRTLAGRISGVRGSFVPL
jgi:uncharacterized protein YjbI with pentapeptide repeats